jgi:hypothetical protein
VQGYDGEPVSLVAAGKGALELWPGNDGLVAAPIDRIGNPTTPETQIAAGTILAITTAPMPNGDALVGWMGVGDTDSTFPMFVVTVAHDGTLRAPATMIIPNASSSFDANVFAIVDASGTRALIVTTSSDGSLEAIPLTCAH